MRIVRSLVAFIALGSWSLAFVVAGQVRAPSEFMEVSEIQPGMTGYGLTVFRGTVPERFDVEVVERPRASLVDRPRGARLRAVC